ncbi:MAG: lysophospholipid acyltransferase family protein [Prevotellaceae bacterium]|jgi:predicted LPLAT superfamily acyltransferase|nr:lysophospholipid acyltransferase family protein [Prevotellaceae bacterium]
MTKSQTWKGNTGGGFLGQQGLIALFRLTGLRSLYFVMALVVPFYMLFSRKTYRAMYRFFRVRLGYSGWKSFISTYKNHFAFGQVILDRFAIFAGRKNLFEVEIIDEDFFYRLTSDSKGFIIAGSHAGNFEIAGYLLRPEGKVINALIYSGETETVRRNRAKALGGNNVRIIPIADDMSHLFAAHAALQKGEAVSMSCDRSLGSSKVVTCDFFNGKADFPVGAFILSTHFAVEVAAIFVMKESNRKYRIHIKSLTGAATPEDTPAENPTRREQAERYTRLFAKELEAIVRQYPMQWFNYHEFWKD